MEYLLKVGRKDVAADLAAAREEWSTAQIFYEQVEDWCRAGDCAARMGNYAAAMKLYVRGYHFALAGVYAKKAGLYRTAMWIEGHLGNFKQAAEYAVMAGWDHAQAEYKMISKVLSTLSKPDTVSGDGDMSDDDSGSMLN